ncbi:hypothetical protein K8T06_11755, partial [bacterium]|nr:hypothetical protein [bacterium]
ARALTAGDGESGILGQWWLRGGFRVITGPIISGVFYEERRSIGDSLESDRSRLEAHISVYQWQNAEHLWELSIRDRYTFDEEWNDIRAIISVKFCGGYLLRNFDRFRLLNMSRIEILSD